MKRLRRDPIGWLAGYTLEPVMAIFFLASAVVGVLGGDVLAGPVFVGFAGVALIPAVSLTALRETELVTGFRPRPRRIARSAIAGAGIGEVRWGRGSPASGVVLRLLDGREIPVDLSAHSRERTRLRWVAEIDRWAAKAEQTTDLFGQVVTLRLSARQAKKADQLLVDNDSREGVLVAAIEFPNVWNSKAHVGAEVMSDAGRVRVTAKKPLAWLATTDGIDALTVTDDEGSKPRVLPAPGPGEVWLLTLLLGQTNRLHRLELTAIPGPTIPEQCRFS